MSLDRGNDESGRQNESAGASVDTEGRRERNLS